MINGSKPRQQGFTIVEVIMFLAISGLMMAGLLIAVSGGINRERYRDATNSFTDFLKEQYNLVDNVQNARIGAEASDPSGCTNTAGTSGRATSNCTIIGRFIRYDGNSLTSLPIIATNDIVGVLNNPAVDKSDAKGVYSAMNLKVPTDITAMNREYTPRWQTRIISPSSDADTPTATVRTFRMVLLRSPLTSIVSTYYADGEGSADAMDVVNSPALERAAYLCIDPVGLAPDKTGVSIDTAGVNSSAIQFATATECRT